LQSPKKEHHNVPISSMML